MKLLVSTLLRRAIAEAPADPRTWLMNVQAACWNSMNTQGGQIVSSTVNGKSVTLSLAGTSRDEIMKACEVALQAMDSGQGPSSTGLAVLR